MVYQKLSFRPRAVYERADPDYNRPAEIIYASRLRGIFAQELDSSDVVVEPDPNGGMYVPDPLETFERRAIEALRTDQVTMEKLYSPEGIAWGSLQAILAAKLPDSLSDRKQTAYHLVKKALIQIVGPQDVAWQTYRNERRNNTTYVVVSQDH